MRAEAVTALGLLGMREAVPYVQPLLDTPDPLLRAVAVKTLLRLEAPLDDGTVAHVFDAVRFGRPRIEILAGLVSAGRRDLLLRLVARALEERPDAYAVRSLLLYAAESAGPSRGRFQS